MSLGGADGTMRRALTNPQELLRQRKLEQEQQARQKKKHALQHAKTAPSGAPAETPPLWSNHADYQTTSWRKDNIEYHKKRRREHKANNPIMKAWNSSLGWTLSALIGLLSGISAFGIENAVNLLSDLKFGICARNPFSTARQCCDAGFSWVQGTCEQGDWIEWDEAAGVIGGYTMYCVIGIIFCTIAALIVQYIAPHARGSGIPEVKTILGGFEMQGVLSFKTLVSKCIGLSLSVSSGLAIGKEGPLVHVACGWANVLGSMSSKHRHHAAKKRELISAAAAAGVSVAFGAPLGGVLFSLEEVSSFFPQKTLLRAFFAASAAAITLQALHKPGESLTQYSVTHQNPISIHEYVPIVFIGVCGGVIGAAFIELNTRVAKIRVSPWYKKNILGWMEVFLIVTFTVILNWNFLLSKPLSSQVIHALFESCETPPGSSPVPSELGICDFSPEKRWEVAGLLIAGFLVRFVEQSVTFGLGVPAGLFVPSLFCGACLGRLVGHTCVAIRAEYGIFPLPIEPGLYAMVGAAAVLAGVCRVTISLVVIMFELTGALQYVVPFMTGVLVAKWVGDAFNVGIYDYYILVKQYPYLHEEPEDHMYEMLASNIMETNLVVLEEEGYTIESLLRFCKQYLFYGFPIVTNAHDGTLLGYLPREKAQQVLTLALKQKKPGITKKTQVQFFPPKDDAELDEVYFDLSDLVDETVMRMVPSTPLDQVHNVFKSLGTRVVFLVARDSLVGMITKKNLLKAAHSHGDSNHSHKDAMHLSDMMTAAEDGGKLTDADEKLPNTAFMPRRATTQAHMIQIDLSEPLLSDITESSEEESESERSSSASEQGRSGAK